MIIEINGKQYTTGEPIIDNDGIKHIMLYPYVPVYEMRTESKSTTMDLLIADMMNMHKNTPLQ